MVYPYFFLSHPNVCFAVLVTKWSTCLYLLSNFLCPYLFLIYFLLFIIGNGLDMDEYVRKAYKFAYSDCIEVGPVACLPEPPDPNELYPRQSNRQAIVVA